MSSFQRLWENMRSLKEDMSSEDDLALSAIRTGIGIREDFWDDFLRLTNNSEGLSALLNVPITDVMAWHDKVKKAVHKVNEKDSESDVSKHKKLIKTGMPEEDNFDSDNIVDDQI